MYGVYFVVGIVEIVVNKSDIVLVFIYYIFIVIYLFFLCFVNLAIGICFILFLLELYFLFIEFFSNYFRI